MFLQVKINTNNTVEKNEIHTITINYRGKWIKENEKLICYFEPTETNFPADTLILKIIGNRMFFERKGKVNNVKFYLRKVKIKINLRK